MRFSHCLSLLVMLFTVSLFAVEFNDFFPETLGLAGAYTSCIDSLAIVYYNPAGLLFFKGQQKSSYFGSLAYGTYAFEQGDFLKYTNDLATLTAIDWQDWQADDVDRLSDLFAGIADGHSLAHGGETYGAMFTKGGYGFSVVRTAYGDVGYSLDTTRLSLTDAADPDSILNNETALNTWGLTTTEYILSYAYPFGEGIFMGTNLKFVVGQTYGRDFGLFELATLGGRGIEDYIDDALKENKQQSTDYTFDLGIMMVFGDWGRLGFVAKNLKAMEFDGVDGPVKVESQYRIGFTMILSQSAFITIDKDLADNDTLLEGVKSNKLSIGLQKSFFNNHLILQAGARKEKDERGEEWRYFGGLGVKLADYMVLNGAFHFAPSDESKTALFGLGVRF